MKIYKNDLLKHKILNTLNAKTNGQAFVGQGKDYKQWAMPVNEICAHAGISEKEYRLSNSLLFDEEEIDIVSINNKEHAYILQKGLTALNENKYTIGSKRRFNLNMVNIINWVAPIIVGIVTIISLWITIFDMNEMKAEISKLKQEISKIQHK